MRSLALASLALLGACSGSYEPLTGADGGGGGEDLVARQEWTENVQPLSNAECSSCHTTGLSAAPIYGETYDQINMYKEGALLNCVPEQSLLYTKGEHLPGLDWRSTSKPIVLAWLETWASVHPRCGGGAAAQAVTGSFVPTLDQQNTVPLDGLGGGLEGASLTFSAQRVTGGLYLTQIRVAAGAGGLHVVAPRFEACLASVATPDPGNAFSAVDVTVEANMSASLPPGSLSIAGWEIGDPLAVSFGTLTPMAGAQGSPVDNGGSCGDANPMLPDGGMATDAGP